MCFAHKHINATMNTHIYIYLNINIYVYRHLCLYFKTYVWTYCMDMNLIFSHTNISMHLVDAHVLCTHARKCKKMCSFAFGKLIISYEHAFIDTSPCVVAELMLSHKHSYDCTLTITSASAAIWVLLIHGLSWSCCSWIWWRWLIMLTNLPGTRITISEIWHCQLLTL